MALDALVERSDELNIDLLRDVLPALTTITLHVPAGTLYGRGTAQRRGSDAAHKQPPAMVARAVAAAEQHGPLWRQLFRATYHDDVEVVLAGLSLEKVCCVCWWRAFVLLGWHAAVCSALLSSACVPMT
jgi:hypothetical protein